MLKFAGRRYGCWIFQGNQNNTDLAKYSCGTGYNVPELKKSIDAFKKGKLERYVFSDTSVSLTPVNKIFLEADDLAEIVKNVNGSKIAPCRLVYFVASKCNSCSKKDVILI